MGFVPGFLMGDAITLWTLWQAGQSVTCTEHIAPRGLEVEVTFGNLPLAAQYCDCLDDAVRWADAIRKRWEDSGWRSLNAVDGSLASC